MHGYAENVFLELDPSMREDVAFSYLWRVARCTWITWLSLKARKQRSCLTVYKFYS